jgi:hypothetical protein
MAQTRSLTSLPKVGKVAGLKYPISAPKMWVSLKIVIYWWIIDQDQAKIWDQSPPWLPLS